MRETAPRPLQLALAAATLLALTMGSRSSVGLLVSPLNTATGLGLATISFVVAAGHLVWGLAQPATGALSRRHGAGPLIAAGCLLFGLANLWLADAGDFAGLLAASCLAAVASAAAGSNGILLGEVGRSAPEAKRGLLLGIVGAGGSLGQLLISPATQALVDAGGHRSALQATALAAFAALPLALCFHRRRGGQAGIESGPSAAAAGSALRSREFWVLAGSFAMCGFHVAFLTSHMPGVIALCGAGTQVAAAWLAVLGLANVAGSLLAGAAMHRIGARRQLMLTYLARAAGVTCFLLAPTGTPLLFGFALWMGLTYMATLPPTAALMARRFGDANLPTLLGGVMALHQVGAFLGAWLGGVVVSVSGDYQWMWYADLGVALLAAALLAPAGATAGRSRVAVRSIATAAAAIR